MFAKLLAAFHHINELFVLVNCVALFKNDWADLIKLLLKA